MDAKLKADWVAALRSGEYRQGFAKLQDGDRFCCLGVLCRIAGLPIDEDGYSPDGYQSLKALAGGERFTSALWRMNDDGKTFPQIANYIEANL